MKIALCILALNELECLKVIFPKIQAPTENTGYSAIYAIDGGSTDGTKEFFKLHNIEIIQQRRRGRGEAIKAAIEQIDADAFLFFSPDGNEDVLDLFRFEEYLKQGADLVIATRMVNGAFNEEDIHWCRPRKWVNLAFNFLANAFLLNTIESF